MIFLIVFIANAAIMVIEIVGARALAPYFGTSTEVWSGILATVLAGLALGYRFGGQYADRIAANTPDSAILTTKLKGLLGICVALAGGFVLIMWPFSEKIALMAAELTPHYGLTLGSVAASLFLLFPASIFLAAVSPIAARASLASLEGSAKVVGTLSSVAALSSIAGSLASGLWIIPLLGSRAALTYTALLLLVTGIGMTLLYAYRKQAVVIGVLVLAAWLTTTYVIHPTSTEANVQADIDTPYNRIRVIDSINPLDKRPIRSIATDPFGTQCASYTDNQTELSDLVFGYTQAFDIAFLGYLNPERVLIIGGCNYSYPKHVATMYPETEIDVVEIDEGMTEAAAAWFNFVPTEKMRSIHADMRIFLNELAADEKKEKYDIAFVDVFNSFSATPHHLVTRESFTALRESIKPQGGVVMNAIGAATGDRARYTASLVHTIQESFNYVTVVKVYDLPLADTQNLIVIGTNDEDAAKRLEALEYTKIAHIPLTHFERSDSIILSDDYSPIEALTKPIRDHYLEERE